MSGRPSTVVYYSDAAAMGGAEQVLLAVMAGLDRARWRPVLLHHPEPGLRRLVDAAAAIGVPARAVPRGAGLGAPLGVGAIAAALAAERPRVFHANLNWPLAARFGLAAAILARVPAIVATEHLYVDVRSPRSILVQRLLSRGVGRYVAVSRALADRLRARFGFPAEKLAVVHNGVDPARFDRTATPEARAALAAEPARPIVLTVARLDRQKGHRYLLAALERLPGVSLALVGDGPERSALEEQARASGVAERVRFLGHRTDVPALLAACDLVVLPSLFEGLPLTVLEGMAAGKPVVATDVDGTGEAVVPDQTGLLVPPADPGRLADAIGRVVTDPELAARLGQAGRARARALFSSESMVRGVAAVYDQLLGPHGR